MRETGTRRRRVKGGEACVQRAGARHPYDGDEVADGERLVKDRHAGSVAMIEAIRPSACTAPTLTDAPAPASALTAFAYDREAAYDPEIQLLGSEGTVAIHELSFLSPRGTGRATGGSSCPRARPVRGVGAAARTAWQRRGNDELCGAAGAPRSAGGGARRPLRAAGRRAAALPLIKYIGFASPTPLLLQSGRQDNLVSPRDAERLHAAAPDPKTVQWYEAGHSLGVTAVRARSFWLHEHLGMRAPDF